jgi:hypothetical protein
MRQAMITEPWIREQLRERHWNFAVLERRAGLPCGLFNRFLDGATAEITPTQEAAVLRTLGELRYEPDRTAQHPPAPPTTLEKRAVLRRWIEDGCHRRGWSALGEYGLAEAAGLTKADVRRAINATPKQELITKIADTFARYRVRPAGVCPLSVWDVACAPRGGVGMRLTWYGDTWDVDDYAMGCSDNCRDLRHGLVSVAAKAAEMEGSDVDAARQWALGVALPLIDEGLEFP